MPLEPCAQTLSEDGHFHYLGGWTPLPEPLATRARSLALQTGNLLPPTVGYVGIDLILGPDGPESDFVLELNPRLTTSYLGLRQLARTKLAEAMLAAATGQPVHLSFGRQHIQFSPDAVMLKAASIE